MVELSCDNNSIILTVNNSNSSFNNNNINITTISSEQFQQQLDKDINSLNEITNNISSGNLNVNYINNNNYSKSDIDYDNEDNLQQYNTFLYWRDPLPIIDDFDIPSYDSTPPVSKSFSISTTNILSSDSSKIDAVNDSYLIFSKTDTCNNVKNFEQQSKEDNQNTVSCNINSIISSSSNEPSSSSSPVNRSNVNNNKPNLLSDSKNHQSIMNEKENKDEASQLIVSFYIKCFISTFISSLVLYNFQLEM